MAQRAQDKTATGDQSREAADCLAVERQAYKSIIAEITTLVLSTDNELSKFLKRMAPGSAATRAPGWWCPVMRLSFPNPSRSYDASSNRICFWGYDCTIEISFFFEADAIKRLCPEMLGAEMGFLQAFDAVRNRIHEVADKVYARGGKDSRAYILVAEDY